MSVTIARGTMSMLTVSGESMAPRALPLGPSWSRGHSGMLARPSLIRVHNANAGVAGKAATTTSRSCRCAAAETSSSSSAEPRVSPRECTYGALNVLWVASELKRLLTMQRNPGDGLVLTRGQWSWDIQQPRHYQFKGVMQFCNTSSRFELFVPEVSAKLQLLSNSSLASITATAQNTLTASLRRSLFWRQRVCNRRMKSSAVAEPDFSEKSDEIQIENILPLRRSGKGDVGSTTMVNAALTSVLPDSRSIHETAIVHPDAFIGEGVVIGAFCTVGSGVSIGYGCKLHPGSHVCGNTELGEGCEIMNGAVVGAEISGRTVLGNHNTVGYHAVVGVKCQDMKYKESDECYLQIGNNNDIREYASIHRSSKPNDCTVIGDNNLIMGSCHVAHDCKLGNHNILANGTLIGGHVILEDYIHTGGAVAIHQHCHIDSYSFLAGGSMVTRDVPMYMMVSGDRAELRGLNLEGMRRLGFSELEYGCILRYDGGIKYGSMRIQNAAVQCKMRRHCDTLRRVGVKEVKSIRRTYQKLFMNSDPDAGGLEDRLTDLEANEELTEVPAVVAMLRSVRNCFGEKRRGICTFRHWTSV